ncbi:unnamed protein product [Moneuplotes crassus]|uniref:Uncharacterized protein n=1 Tax=Euplotes crassus TaxID=5936 RepID=A0AAD1XY23_EUPCR|nr:unnamed protein product [Moneuplotes crassus]
MKFISLIFNINAWLFDSEVSLFKAITRIIFCEIWRILEEPLLLCKITTRMLLRVSKRDFRRLSVTSQVVSCVVQYLRLSVVR